MEVFVQQENEVDENGYFIRELAHSGDWDENCSYYCVYCRVRAKVEAIGTTKFSINS